MRILITGGAGYIGSHVALEALQSGHEVCIYDNYFTSDARNSSFLGYLGARLVTGDILNEGQLNRCFDRFRPDLVIHMAGLKRVDQSQDVPQLYYRVNVAGTMSVLEAMETAGCGKLVFSSSAAIYDESDDRVSESSLIKPKSVYGHTKVMCEKMIADFVQRGNDAVCLRYFNPVASHERLPERNSVTLMGAAISVAAGLKQELTIYGDGSAVRDFIHVRDVARAHLGVTDVRGHKVYNIGTGQGHSVMELVMALEEQLRRDLPKRFLPARDSDIRQSVANCDLIRDEIGWMATQSLEEMCHDALDAENLRLSSDR